MRTETMMTRNNVNYKRIRMALALSGSDVVNICRIGGLDISGDRTRRWARSTDAGSGRYSTMSDDEFDAFCAGLPEWMRAQDEK